MAENGLQTYQERLTQLIPEDVFGTYASGNTPVVAQDLSGDFQDQVDFQVHIPEGFNDALASGRLRAHCVMNKTIEQFYYTLLPQRADMVYGRNNYSDTNDGSLRTRRWRMPQTGRRGIIPMTIEYGLPSFADRATGGIATEFAIASDRAGTTNGRLNMIAKAPSAGVPMTGAGTDEVQQVVVENSTGGTFTLSYGGYTTGNIAYDATADAVRAALVALASIDQDSIVVTKPSAFTYRIQFINLLGLQNIAQITGSATNLVGSGHALAITSPTAGVAGTAILPSTRDAIYPAHWEVRRAASISALADSASVLNEANGGFIESHELVWGNLAGPYWMEDGTGYLTYGHFKDMVATKTASVVLAQTNYGHFQSILEDAGLVDNTNCGKSIPKWWQWKAACGDYQAIWRRYMAVNDNIARGNNDNVYNRTFPLVTMLNLEAGEGYADEFIFIEPYESSSSSSSSSSS